ncbi:uncharacterized protein JCM10292_000187 [Rhodotorula paludigena]|uniref:uncharacterized protein n=1 Tax=Rhodotorula paludigena TaxID=86838 RepID=UPI00317B30F4
MSTVHPRPLCRTRRRSSSLSAILDDSSASPSSPDSPHRAHAPWSRYRATKRTRTSTSGDSPLLAKLASPLKQSQQALFPPPQEEPDTSFWAHPSPFALAPPPPATGAAPFSTFALPSQSPGTLFCTSASDFALPSVDFAASRTARARNASTESTAFPSHISLSSSKGSFDDSSFSSLDSSPPHSVPSASTSPDFASALFSPSSSASTTAAAASRPPAAPPVLRRVSSCSSPMLCDGSMAELGAAPPARCADALVGEAERLHHVAFEHLRESTRAHEAGFVERMRRWEQGREVHLGSSRPQPDEGSDATGLELGDEEDEIEVMLDLGDDAPISPSAPHAVAPTWQAAPLAPPPPVSRSELDELTRRLCAGACELEDYALVREVQARARPRSQEAAPLA